MCVIFPFRIFSKNYHLLLFVYNLYGILLLSELSTSPNDFNGFGGLEPVHCVQVAWCTLV